MNNNNINSKLISSNQESWADSGLEEQLVSCWQLSLMAGSTKRSYKAKKQTNKKEKPKENKTKNKQKSSSFFYNRLFYGKCLFCSIRKLIILIAITMVLKGG